MKFKLSATVIMSLIGIFSPTYQATAENFCSNDGAIATIQFQTCSEIVIKLGGSRPRISVEEFTIASVRQTSLVVANYNVVAVELIAKALIERNQGTLAPTILAYKIPEYLKYKNLDGVAPTWIALR